MATTTVLGRKNDYAAGSLLSSSELNSLVNDTETVAINARQYKLVRIASTGNLGLSGLSAIDGITPNSGDRVLAKNQTTAADNGIYSAVSGAWSRATDSDQALEMPPGTLVYASEGTVNADTLWALTTDATITLGATSLVFANITTRVAVATKTTTYAITNADDLIRCDTTGGGFTVTLPAVATVPAGQQFTIKKISSDSNLVTLGTTSSQLIDGATTKTWTTQYTSYTVKNNGASWDII